jgi:hypothetical protein
MLCEAFMDMTQQAQRICGVVRLVAILNLAISELVRCGSRYRIGGTLCRSIDC